MVVVHIRNWLGTLKSCKKHVSQMIIWQLLPRLKCTSSNWWPSWILHFEFSGAFAMWKKHKTLTKCSESMHIFFYIMAITFWLIKGSLLAIGGHLGFCMLKAKVHSKRKISIRNRTRSLQTCKNMYEIISYNKYFPTHGFTAIETAVILNFAFCSPRYFWNVKYTS